MLPNEEDLQVKPWLLWLAILLLTAMLLGFGMVLHHTIADPARRWDFGAQPDTPAQSIESTDEPQVEGAVRQLPAPPDTLTEGRR